MRKKVSLWDKMVAILRFVEREKCSYRAKEVLHYLMTNRDLLRRTKFVDDVSLAPNVLVCIETPSRDQNSLHLKLEKSNVEVSALNQKVNKTNESPTVRISPSNAVLALEKHKGDLLVMFVLIEEDGETPEWLEKALEENPYSVEFQRIKEEQEKEREAIIRECVEIELEIITLKSSLDKLLEREDFETCRVIKERLTDLDNRSKELSQLLDNLN